MFTAMVLACFIDGSCVELTDSNGPYKQEIDCQARVATMMQDFVSAPQTPPVQILRFKCEIKQDAAT